jgi:hypothetical protein
VSRAGGGSPGSQPEGPREAKKQVSAGAAQNGKIPGIFLSSSLRQGLVSMGLPQDSLSAALLIFSRFFSRGGDGNLKELRRQVLNAFLPPAKGEKGKVLENMALAAAAALDKGVRLSPKALAAYACTMGIELPGEKENYSSEVPPSPETTENGVLSEQSGSGRDGKGSGGENPGKDPEDSEGKTGALPGPEELKRLFSEDPPGGLLDFLNRIPGENGQKWIVWPFAIRAGDVALEVVIRVLLKEPLSAVSGRLILDAAGPKNCWRFILDKSGGETLKVCISVYPERTAADRRVLEREAERILVSFLAEEKARIKMSGTDGPGRAGASSPPVEIHVSTGGSFPSLAEFVEKEVLLSINKKV